MIVMVVMTMTMSMMMLMMIDDDHADDSVGLVADIDTYDDVDAD